MITNLPCFNWLPAYVWRDSASFQSFTDWFTLGRCFQNSSYSWKRHITFLLIPAVGEQAVQTTRNLFSPCLFENDTCWLPCMGRLKKKYLFKENKDIHLVFTFSPMKDCSGPWKSNGDAAELPAALPFPTPEMTDQASLLPAWNSCPETKQHETWQTFHPENPALHIQSFSQKIPLIFMGEFALYFKHTSGVSLKLDSHPKKHLGSKLLGRFFAWSRQSSFPYHSSPLGCHQHG